MPITVRGVFTRSVIHIAAAILVCATGLSASEEPKSAAVAKELSQALDAAKLDGIAAADPSAPGTFVAVIYIPETQFLVVSAKYSAPSLLVDKIKKGDYRGVYMDLHAAAIAGTRVFIQDQGLDGLRSQGDIADSWEEGGKTLDFDGGKKAKMSDAEYSKRYTDADERYAKMLSLLLAQTKQLKGKFGS